MQKVNHEKSKVKQAWQNGKNSLPFELSTKIGPGNGRRRGPAPCWGGVVLDKFQAVLDQAF
ncbi:MAG TPA: hypothetical protein DDW49_08875 [Deltaproteobacteria bacterium]|nr:hypothetical protein [Deltaproteobacteria bacterium]